MSLNIITLLASLLILLNRDAVAEPNRTIHEPNLAELVQRVLTGTYTVDPEFISYFSHPSPFYTDLYGIHALRDFTRVQILNDFVPRYANVSRDGTTNFELTFQKGWNATFYPHAILDVKGVLVARDHVYIGGNNARELINNLQDFYRMLNESGLSQKYLVGNPFYTVEQTTNDLYYSGKPPTSVTVDPNLVQFHSKVNAVLIYPDGVHGDLASYEIFMETLKNADIQWFGMEMLPSSMQSIIDDFCTSPSNTSAYFLARQNLTNYFLHAWTPYFQLNITSGDQSPYFQAVDLVRQKNGRVYGLDMDSVEFLLFRYGESDFGASVRSRHWALSVPAQGRGIMFGGSAHFKANRSSNVQDFLRLRDQNLPLFSIRELTPNQPSSIAVQLTSHIFYFIISLFVYRVLSL